MSVASRKHTAEAPAHALQRTTSETSRLLEFFSEKELTMQIGHPKPRWPIALLKELLDNGLDGCETAGASPRIAVTIESDAIRVRDNGPGLPEATLIRSLDYTVRVSDKAHYISPTRGQLGNALKCIYAAPYVVDGERGRVDIATRGVTYTISVRLDRIAQLPVLDLTTVSDGRVKVGTDVVMHWPQVASCMAAGAEADFYKPAGLIRRFAAFNPHCTITYHEGGRIETFARTQAAWRKWRPSHPTSPLWYTAERLRALVAAYIAADRVAGRRRTVREVVAEFAGLSGTAKQKAVAAAAGLTGARLGDLVAGDDLDVAKVTALLRAMQQASRPIKPQALGVLGAAHLTEHLVAHWRVTRESVRYAKRMAVQRGLPFVVEAAFGIRAREQRVILAGLNFSPILNPDTFHVVTDLTGANRIDRGDPVVLAVHLACPRLGFADRGKSVLALEEDEEADDTEGDGA